MQRVMDEIKVIIDERRTKPHSDFISDLVNAREAGEKPTDKELFDQISVSPAARCPRPAAPPAARSCCSTPTTTSAQPIEIRR